MKVILSSINRKKRYIRIIIILSLALIFTLTGCSDDVVVSSVIEDVAPATPQGVTSVTGDEVVYLFFNGIYEDDVKEYEVYRSLFPDTGYSLIVVLAAENNPNLDLIIYEYADSSVVNGNTYYYAVSSVDYAGNVSALSAENVFDTPRPEGQAPLFANAIDPSLSGFNLSTAQHVDYRSQAADIFVDSLQSVFYLNAANVNTDIQDVGHTVSFDEVGFAPTSGWSQLGFVEIILGHTYIIWTLDNHYAKMRAISINASGSVSFEWAYQTAVSNPELAPPRPDPSIKTINNKLSGMIR